MTLFNKLNIQNDLNKNSLYPLNLLSKYLQNISTEEPPKIDSDIFELFIQEKTLIQWNSLTTEQIDILINFTIKNQKLSYLENNLLIFQNISYTILTIPTLFKKKLFSLYHQKSFQYFDDPFNIRYSDLSVENLKILS